MFIVKFLESGSRNICWWQDEWWMGWVSDMKAAHDDTKAYISQRIQISITYNFCYVDN